MTFYPNIHEEVQRVFPDFDYNAPVGRREVICNMADPNNKVGHQQRAFTTYWALKTCGPLDLGLDIGSTRGLTPYCIHLDKFANGKPHPVYTDQESVLADVCLDMADLSVLPDTCFPYLCSNHSLEHADVSRYLPSDAPRPPAVQQRDFKSPERLAWIELYPKWRDEFDAGVVRMLREEWLRVLRLPETKNWPSGPIHYPGGLMALCVPDAAYFDVIGCDSDHKHAWSHKDFEERILNHLRDVVRVVEFDTLKNNFSFNVLLERVK
jgi:hypothetical protein